MEAALALAGRAHGCCAPPTAANGARRISAAAAAPRFGPRRRSRLPLRALPPELSEILSPKLVPGSPADTGDVSSLIPISAVMLLFYFVSNWVVPEMLMKGLRQEKQQQEPKGDEAAYAAPTLPPPRQQGDTVDGQRTDIADASPSGKMRLKVKTKKKRSKADIKV